jgi:hypothetical protein
MKFFILKFLIDPCGIFSIRKFSEDYPLVEGSLKMHNLYKKNLIKFPFIVIHDIIMFGPTLKNKNISFVLRKYPFKFYFF